MRIPSLLLAFSLAALTVSAQAPAPRKAPEFTITEGSGKQSLLSSYRGKVVVLAFIFTTCPHCQAACGVMTKLQGELGPKGFQALGVAFNDNANLLVSSFVENFHVGFPVGSANRDEVKNYLQLDDRTPWMVPQIVLIDRKGMIVEQSAAKGTEELQKEDTLRAKITALLGPSPKTMSKKAGH
ncbi:MAG TPA: TlpA disulfide reductase family protein [Bryobacteraceae bacterium]|nr:TlpA disulfide reductase family protein [Bryobacteraceae bacterium]